jgi:hypothetical protein
MTDPVAGPSLAVTAGGITLLGIATGLHPELLLAGAAGGWWALSYVPPIGIWARANRVMLSSAVAAWAAPPAAAWAGGIARHMGETGGWLPDVLPAAAWQIVAALGIGLLAVDVLGRGLLAIGRARLRRCIRETDK